jgi:hypothetical protein
MCSIIDIHPHQVVKVCRNTNIQYNKYVLYITFVSMNAP